MNPKTASSQTHTDSDAASCTSAPVNVLVVDDVEANLHATRSLLARPGVFVLIASSAASALELLEQHDVALAILDVQMPEIDGFELAEHMRRSPQTCSVPIMFLTGHDAARSRTFQGYEAGAVDFLIKPVDPLVLESKVGVFVGLYKQRRELFERNAELERLLQHNQAIAEELRMAHGRAITEANTDVLTGVSNRRHILQLAEATLLDRRQQARPLSRAVCDLDHFKAVNDTHGHDVGDAVLRAFCSHVTQGIRTSHTLGRIGGEEFLLLMPGTSLDDAEVVLLRLHRTLNAHDGISFTFSAGIAQADAGEDLHSVIKRAVEAMDAAKRAGRDCSVTSPAPL